MLDCSHQAAVAIPSWEDVELKARLPLAVHEFFAKKGDVPSKEGCERKFPRNYFRTRAVLSRRSQAYGVYLCDISPVGLGLYSPIQLLPCEQVSLWLPGGKRVELTIENCIRHANNSYRCGASFVAAQ